MSDADAALQLAFAGMHPDRRLQLRATHPSAAAVLNAIWTGRVVLPPAAVAATRVPATERRAGLSAAGISVVFLGEADYPEGLASLANPPPVLFVRGSLPVEPGVAIVGTRQATGYGLRLAERFGRAMADDGRTVISGLARGIDAAAHRGAVDGDGQAVAVLGNGVDRWYPAANRALGERVLARGAVISEYPPGARPSPWRFPPRNRIIVGLSSVVVVVEAAMPGGAMITGRMAVDEHRELFAVPGDIGRASSVGCNLLIRDGAWPVLGVDDLSEAVDRVMGPSAGRHRVRDTPALIKACDPAGTPIDVLAVRCGRPVSELLGEISTLEMEGRLRVESGWVIPG